MKKILVAGCNNKMGENICRMISEIPCDMIIPYGIDARPSFYEIYDFPVYSSEILKKRYKGEIENPDAIIDVSKSKSLTGALLDFARENIIPIVVTTADLPDNTLNYMKEVSEKVPVFYSVDISDKMGIVKKLIEVLAEFLPDSEIVITEKLGAKANIQLSNCTINMLKETAMKAKETEVTTRLKDSHISISNIYAEDTCGSTYTISFNGKNSNLQVTYTTHSGDAFAEGAINALKFIMQEGRKPKLYSVEDLF